MKTTIHIFFKRSYKPKYWNIVIMIFWFMLVSFICRSQEKVIIESLEKLPFKATKYSFNIDNDAIIYGDLNDSRLKRYDLKSREISTFDQSYGQYDNFANPEKFGHQKVKSSDDLRAIQILEPTGKWKEIRPFGNKDYINVSLSPDEDRILFRVSGMGAFITNLNGDIDYEFPEAEFPSWINDKLILFAKIEDDGHQFKSSDLYIMNIKSGKEMKVTGSIDRICLFPKISSNSSTIIFSTPAKEIYLIKFKL